ncbi:MAG: ABC transporter permease [Candidatus Electryonea clarkiae]|nr:ABC transporter permease [Candidatus Electryonea clarkiae]MDP8285880.1 ABC transporter permease [Candidatus Electryonea clarkiae]
MKYTFFIANRYLRSKRRTKFISLITYLSAGGVALGAATLVIVLSVANGFESEVKRRIIGADAHLRVSTFHEQGAEDWIPTMAKILEMENVEAVSPYVLDKGMIRHGRHSEGCVIRGIDPKTIGDVNDLPQMIISGSLDSLTSYSSSREMKRNKIDDTQTISEHDTKNPGDTPALPGIILGRYLADVIYGTEGDTVFLFSPTGTSLFAQPRVGKFRIVGIFESGLAEFDQVFAYVEIGETQKLFGMGNKVSGLDVRTTRLEDAESVKEKISATIGYPWYPRTWFEMRKTLYSWMRLEKWAFFIILSLIILVAAFNIISTLVMVTMEKKKEIGILVAMGATRKEIAQIFLYLGLSVGITGTAIGLSVGWALLAAQQKFQFIHLPPEVYMLAAFPVEIQAMDFLAVGLAGLVICLLASVYPARRAASLDPVEAIRYE